ncbi:MAG: hypothetical protein HYS81_03035 [Candidatus Aenigmatarchaeota archaeon]|nr:MAG: hypothetical protein HYS81_03035 [Candidatus Aenigmarchaeota archaeon]
MKGQVISADFVVAFFIFLAIVLGLFLSWNGATDTIGQIYSRNAMQRAGGLAADSLVRSPGEPDDWTAASVTALGLADDAPNVLNADKVSRMLNVPYETSRNMLRMPTDFSLEINRTSGAAFTVNNTQAVYGTQPFANATNIVVVRRLVVMGGIPGVLTMKVWA